MQIDRYNHLQFPRDANTGNNPAATGKDAALSAAGVLAKPLAGAAVPATAVVRTPTQWSAFMGLQQIAAKLNVFA